MSFGNTKRAQRMQQPEPKTSDTAAALLGDCHPLLEQLGSTDGLVTLASAAGLLRVPQVTNFESLIAFLHAYKSRLLLAVELPAIQRAYDHACGNQTRELIALDQEIGAMQIPRDFASASQRIGRGQLQRLRPLRDERLAQRYLLAAEEGRAHGWHTLVYGLTLALYSVPVREGLLNYSRQTLRGFIHAAGTALHLSETICLELVETFCKDIPQQLESLLNKAIVYHTV
jgi:urease accessory protein UreF